MVEIRCCASRGMMPHFTHPLSMITEGRSWNLTEADEPETRLEEPGMPITDKSGLPDGSGSSRRMPTSTEAPDRSASKTGSMLEGRNTRNSCCCSTA